MIHTIERRTICDGGVAESHYEVRAYTRRGRIGILMDGKTIKTTKTKAQAESYCKSHGITVEER